MQPVTARLNGSVGLSRLLAFLGLMLEAIRQVSATLTEDSGSSVPKQRW